MGEMMAGVTVRYQDWVYLMFVMRIPYETSR